MNALDLLLLTYPVTMLLCVVRMRVRPDKADARKARSGRLPVAPAAETALGQRLADLMVATSELRRRLSLAQKAARPEAFFGLVRPAPSRG